MKENSPVNNEKDNVSLVLSKVPAQKCLKWYYDQKIISFFSSDFESVFA